MVAGQSQNAEQLPGRPEAAELQRYAALFDCIEGKPLTQEQRSAAMLTSPRSLVVAAAGSGKTSTIVGKVAHALVSGDCQPEGILVLAFNKKAAAELRERVSSRLSQWVPAGTGVAVRTLHALGLDIVRRVEGRHPAVLDDNCDQLLRAVLAQCVDHDAEFTEQWLLFRAFYHATVRHPDEFSKHAEWLAFVRRHGQQTKGRYGFTTARGELVQTQFEQAVANWLFLHGVEYVYRPRSLWHRFVYWCCRNKVRPLRGYVGYWLPVRNTFVYCVTVPDKRRHPSRLQHFLRSPGGVCVTLEDFRAGAAFGVLRTGLNIDPIMTKGRMSLVLKRLGQPLTSQQFAFLRRFVRMARLAGRDPQDLGGPARGIEGLTRLQLHAPMLERLLAAYNAAVNGSDSIDFEGMLHRASAYLEARRYHHPYTLILVDEFQDTSYGGIRLLQLMLAQRVDCRLFAVGDDWQSIYRFAGAAPDVLSRFHDYFGRGTVRYLTTTFRFNQDIADLASCFIQHNSEQLRKHVHARPRGLQASVIVGRYGHVADMMAQCEACLADLMATVQKARTTLSVYVLGRYKHQRPVQLNDWKKRFPSLRIEFLTVHAAKGLEADVVIVLGLHEGRYGFPSMVQDDPLMALVMPQRETFSHAEERRLFYVALTRARTRIYLLACARQPSPFAVEIMELARRLGNAAERRTPVLRELQRQERPAICPA